MNHSLRSIALCIATAAPFACHAQPAAPSTSVAAAPCVRSIGTDAFQRRVVEKAQQSPAALRDYIYITRGMHNVSVEEAMAFADTSRSCGSAANVASAR